MEPVGCFAWGVKFTPVLAVGERLEAAARVVSHELAEARDLWPGAGRRAAASRRCGFPVEVDERERPRRMNEAEAEEVLNELVGIK